MNRSNKTIGCASVRLAATVAALASLCNSASADGTSADTAAATNAETVLYSKASTNNLFSFDYGVPSSPALNLIGLTPDKTTVSTSLKPFALSLPQLVAGSADQSAALDIAPLWLLGTDQNDGYNDYVNGGYWDRFKYRFRTEFALFTGDNGGGTASKAKASQMAFGVSISLLDDSDPLMAVDPSQSGRGSGWLSCLKQNVNYLQTYTYLPADVQQHQYQVSELDASLIRLVDEIKKDADVPSVAELSGIENVAKATPAEINGMDVSARFAFDLSKIEQAIGVIPAQVKRLSMTARLTFDRKAADALIDSLNKPTPQETAANTKAVQIIQSCTTDANRFARFAPNLSFGAGANTQGTPGTLGGFKDTAAVLWLSGKYPLGLHLGDGKTPDVSDAGSGTNAGNSELDYWMVGGSARAAFSSLVTTGVAATPQIRANTFDGWVGLERNSSWLILSGQAGYQDVSATSAAQSALSKSGWRWLTSASLKLSSDENGIWLDLSYGSAQGTTQTLDDKTVMLALNFGPANPANLFGENSTN